MNRKPLFLIIILLFMLPKVDICAHPPSKTEMAILIELKEIRKMVKALNIEIIKLKNELKEKEVQEKEEKDKQPAYGGFHTRRANISALRKIKLPDNPSEEQAGEYIDKIMDATKGQNSFSSEDPQVKMYKKIGPKYLGLLIETAGQSNRGFEMGRFHLERAIEQLAEEKHKKLILEHLPENHFLVKLIVKHGWEKDAKKILIDELESHPERLPTEWIQAVASLNDPDTFDDLKWYLIHGNNRYNTFQALQELPKIDLTEAVADAWSRSGENEWEERNAAKFAIQYGHISALKHLLDSLLNGESQWEAGLLRKIILRHINFYGTNKEIGKWVQKNEENLVFDKRTKKFKLKQNQPIPQKQP